MNCYPSSPRSQGTASSFYRPREGGLQSCRMALSAVCGSMAYNVVELTTILAHLAFGRRHCGSCARPRASRVVALELLLDHRPYANSRAWLAEDRRPHSGGRGDDLSTWVPTVQGMALQCLGWRRSGGDGRTGPEVTGKMRPADLTSQRRPRRGGVGGAVPLSRVPPSSFKGATWRRYGSGRHNVME
jgi:hypothetical protein